MTTDTFQRKLTAILSADVVGYSRLMGDDEESTVHTLNKYKQRIFDLIERHNGRLVDSPGDNVLAEFVSVVDAVRCGVQIQEDLKENNEDLPINRKMEFRIGINTGDVIQDGDRIYGDGVNVAARIESLAAAGGICLSRTAYDQVKKKLNYEYEFLGEYEVKNIDEPVRVYRVKMEPEPKTQIVKEKRVSFLSDKPSIAVLPFINMSNDPDQEYFSDGMTEELINALAKLEGLKVISRTSAFYFKGEKIDLRTIGEKLGVENVLEGSVRKAGNKLRITAQLIKVDDDTHLWSEAYNRELEDVFAIQEEISHAVVENLKVKLLDEIKGPLVKDYTKSFEAYEFFLKGKYILNQGTFEWEKLFDYFERAIKADPNFAPAYSFLAISYVIQATQISLPSNEVWTKVKSLALKAMEIDEMDANTHMAMGRIKAYYEYDWHGAEVSFKRALELNPSISDIHIEYGIYLLAVGRVYEAIERVKRALEIDPASIVTTVLVGSAYFFAREIDKAIDQSRKALELSPNASLPLQLLASSYSVKGMYDEAISILQRFKDIPIFKTLLGYTYGKAGTKKEAQEILDNFLERSEKGHFSPYSIAVVYAGLGEKVNAFEWLEKSVEEHNVNNWVLKVSPIFDDLRSDSRWTKLMEKMNLAD
jgi:TolB-like protein/class 3 adenylate cyclase/Tfp pilus assembly protein PilF